MPLKHYLIPSFYNYINALPNLSPDTAKALREIKSDIKRKNKFLFRAKKKKKKREEEWILECTTQ